jgi:2,3-bisphosphoglycerate-dependent phosphoglycerate mutase
MTTVYFIRHAQADNSVCDGRIRPLTEKGLVDRKLVAEFLMDFDGINCARIEKIDLFPQ